MASNYPGSLDTFNNPTSSTALNASGYEHATLHSSVADAIEAIEGELGTDPAGTYPTVVTRLGTVPTSIYSSPSGFYSGCDYWTLNPALGTSNVALTSQTVYFQRWACPASFTATKLWWANRSVASTVTAAAIGIYSSGGTLLQSADIASVITSVGVKSATITSQSVSAGSAYYIAYFVHASSTGNLPASANYGTATTELMGASSSDRPGYTLASQSSLPSSVTFSSLTVAGQLLVLGVSAS